MKMMERINELQRRFLQKKVNIVQNGQQVDEVFTDPITGDTVHIMSMYDMTFIDINGKAQNLYGLWNQYFSPVHRALNEIINRGGVK